MLKNSAFLLILAVLALCSLGLVMLASVSAFAPANQGDTMFFIKRQGIWLSLGVIVCIISSQIDYHRWLHFTWLALAGSILLMLLCLVPGIGMKINGAHRWLNLGPMNFQPVEAAKISVVIFLAMWLGKFQKKVTSWKEGFVYPIAIVSLVLGCCVLQKDLGSTALLFTITLILLFVAGTRIQFIAPIFIVGMAGILSVALLMPQRLSRIMAFLNPEEHKLDAGWQLWHALLAFGSGGLSGKGLGASVQKMEYLPESHTDFIFPIIGEELGLICTLTVVFCFLLLALSGGFISCHAPEGSGVYLGMGLTSLIVLQTGMNMAVVTGLMPTKGIGLPFISYGGSNLLFCLFAIGVLLNIHKQAVYEVKPTQRASSLPPVMRGRM
ncbi:MAG: putative lipid II flippase FtsW [Verrucomicrobiota bacterium]